MLTPGTLVYNRYLVQHVIGQGGMGVVYEAIDQRLKSRVALKQTLITVEHLRKAFEREAQLLANLRHPALPKVIDHFTDDQGQFLVMEFIPGDDLATLLARRGLRSRRKKWRPGLTNCSMRSSSCIHSSRRSFIAISSPRTSS
jgi:serine/threonine protein kinase